MRYLGVLFLAFLFSCSCTPHRQPGRLDAAGFQTLLETVAAGWSSGDARRASEAFTVDAIYTEPPDKQLYRGREELFRFFGGTQGRESMRMNWHHLVFDEATQVGAGEFTFESGESRVHGVAMIRIRDGKIANWREYWYASALPWESFKGLNDF